MHSVVLIQLLRDVDNSRHRCCQREYFVACGKRRTECVCLCYWNMQMPLRSQSFYFLPIWPSTM